MTHIPSAEEAVTHQRSQAPAVRLLPGAMVAAIGGPLALAVTNALVGFGPVYRDAESTSDLVAAIGSNQGLVQAEIMIGLLATALIVPGIWAVTQILSVRTPVLATIGGWLMGTGYVFSMVLSTETATALAVAVSGSDPAGFADAMDNHTPLAMTIVYVVFGLGALLGVLLLGVAMLRQRSTVPAWAGWALVASAPVRVLGLVLGLAVGPPLASVLILIGFAGLLIAHRRAAR